MKAFVIWLATLGLLLSLFGLWVGAHERRASKPASSSLYTDTVEPELPTLSEVAPEVPETIPAITF